LVTEWLKRFFTPRFRSLRTRIDVGEMHRTSIVEAKDGTYGNNNLHRVRRHLTDLIYERCVRKRLFHYRHPASFARHGPDKSWGLLAPLFIAMDLFAFATGSQRPGQKPDLILLLPGLLVSIGLGFAMFGLLDHRADDVPSPSDRSSEVRRRHP
jgi:hypothetical protein